MLLAKISSLPERENRRPFRGAQKILPQARSPYKAVHGANAYAVIYGKFFGRSSLENMLLERGVVWAWSAHFFLNIPNTHASPQANTPNPAKKHPAATSWARWVSI